MWGEQYAWLKTLELLLCNPQRLRRFVFSCVKGSAYDSWQNAFLDGKFKPMYETWDARKFSGDAEEAREQHGSRQDGFKPADISSALNNKLRICYTFFITTVNSVLEEASAWSERCPCHERIQKRFKEYVPVAHARAEFGCDTLSLIHI
eukprot:6111075-Alexandrium_andersonii.AAC.1